MFSLAAQEALFSCEGLLGIAESFGVEGGAVFDHRVEDAGQFVCGGGDGGFGVRSKYSDESLTL